MSEVDLEFNSIWKRSSPHWRMWRTPENRCLVPANRFAEYASEPNPQTKKKEVVWFALNEDRQLFAFAGIWTEYRGNRGTKSKPVPGPHLIYGFLTTPAVVKPIQEIDRASYCCGTDLMVPCMNACISSRVSRPSLLVSIALKIRS
jgi:putative SOS response-associated peptidase YedK